MSETLTSIFAIIGIFIVLPITILLIWGKIRDHMDRKRTPADPAKVPGSEAYRSRLLNPKFAALEKHFGRKLPTALYDLYGQTDLLVRHDILVKNTIEQQERDWTVANFLPADGLGLSEGFYPLLGVNRFAFAVNESGDLFYVNVDGHENRESKVYLYYHDGGDHELVFDSLDEMISHLGGK